MNDADRARRRWRQARRILRWRRFVPESRAWALDVLRGRGRPMPRCLAVVTAIHGAPVNSVAVADSHWALLQVVDRAVNRTGPCVITVHDLDEESIMSGLLVVLACDESGSSTTLPPPGVWNTHSS